MKEHFSPTLSELTIALVRSCLVPLSAFVAVGTLGGIYFDLNYDIEAFFISPVDFVIFCAEFLLLVVIMRTSGQLENGRPANALAYVLIYVVTAIAIVVGLILMIVPGLYLMLRFLPSLARAVQDDGLSLDPVKWSWAATRQVQPQLAKALIGPVILLLITIGIQFHWSFVYMETEEVWPSYELWMTVAANLIAILASAWLTILAVASCALLSDRAQASQIDA